MKTVLALAAIGCLLTTPLAAQPTPVGVWRTFDDHTGRESGRVLVEQHDGVLTGRIIGTVDPVDATRRCERCSGALKNAPVLGLTIIAGMHADHGGWGGGTILDPRTGDVYDCTMRLADDGKTLVVHGYLVISLLGRSQTWIRAP